MLLFKRSWVIIPVYFFLIAITGCKEPYEMKSGDLLFQINESNPFTDAITTTTGNRQKFSFSHVAIVAVEKDQVYIIEAIPKGGVQKTSLQRFLDSSAHTSDGKPLVIAYRLKKDVHAPHILNNAGKLLGLPYDSAFIPGNNAIYCSELVYESYLDDTGHHIFAANPMSFKDSTGQTSLLWINYYNKLHKPIPEGVPGTNPNDMSKEKSIEEVYRYF